MKRLASIALVLILIFSMSASAAISVRLQDGALLMDENGETIVPMGVYEDIAPLGDGFFAAKTDGGYALMDSEGRQLTEGVYSDIRIEGNVLSARRDEKWGLLDLNGNEISAFEFGKIVADGEGAFWAVRGNTNDEESDALYILNDQGAESETGIYVRGMLSAASEGLLAVQLPESGLWGYCSAAGEMAIPAAYSYAGEFTCGRAVVIEQHGYAAIDAHGAPLFEERYDYLEISSAGFMLASITMEGVRLLDMDGKTVRTFDGEDVFGALAGDGFIIADGQQLRLFDAAGNETAALAPDAAVYEGIGGQMIFSEGAWGEACVHLEDTDAYHQNIYPLGTADGMALYAFMQANAARYVNDMLGEIQLSVDMESARYGVINGRGEEILACRYQGVEYLGNGRLLVQADGLAQVVGTDGQVYWSHGVMQTEEPIS